jgi:hypothetical protein
MTEIAHQSSSQITPESSCVLTIPIAAIFWLSPRIEEIEDG